MILVNLDISMSFKPFRGMMSAPWNASHLKWNCDHYFQIIKFMHHIYAPNLCNRFMHNFASVIILKSLYHSHKYLCDAAKITD